MTGMGRAARVMGAATAVSRLLGFGRVLVIAAVLGTTDLGNIFSASNSVSNVLFDLLAAGALSAGCGTDPAPAAQPISSQQSAAPAPEPTLGVPDSGIAPIALAKWTGDLDGMIERRLIRVLTTYSKTHFFIDQGTQRGLVPDAVKLFGALKTYTYGAAPMPPPLLRAAMEAWPDTDFLQVYGLTEVGGVATQLSAEDHRTAVSSGHPERLVSAGKPIPGVEVKVVDPGTLADVAVGEHGELWLAGDNIVLGYWRNEEATKETFVEHDEGTGRRKWLRTGDRVWVDETGRF